MAQHGLQRQWKRDFLAAFLLMPVLILLIGGSGKSAMDADQQRADILEIQISAGDSPSKMPPVLFFHDQHTRALEQKGCDTCHLKDPENETAFVFEFKEADKLDYKAGMELFHSECVGCHGQRSDEAKPHGPLVDNCRQCHQKDPGVESAQKMVSFDKSLHFRHVSAGSISYQPEKSDKNCGACHHIYNEKTEKLIYQEGAEGTCRYCHEENRQDDIRTFRNAVHSDCVNCHRKLKADDTEAGPIECQGCHSAEGLAKIEIIEDVPRIQRGQPDAVLLSDWVKKASETGEIPSQRTKAVPFDHRRHESANATCRGCHHASLDPCGKCHQTRGIEEGAFVTLQEAMHQTRAEESCIGCHNVQKTETECAGCHALKSEKRFVENNCTICHEVGADLLPGLPVNDTAKQEIAASAIKKRPDRIGLVDDEQIPEMVKIGVMVDEFGPAEFPHRKIVHSLAEKINSNRMAAAFHTGETSLCAGCHHHSPASVTPPKCIGCHKISGSAAEDARPGLRGAYHGQCIGCHKQLGMEKPAATDCEACHEKRPEQGYVDKESVGKTDKTRG